MSNRTFYVLALLIGIKILFEPGRITGWVRNGIFQQAPVT